MVTLVGSGDQVLELPQTINPDVILLDVRMPGLNGDEALPRILAMKPQSRVILLTGHGEQASARKAFEIGAFDYLCKPCDVNILVARIHDAVDASPNGQGREKKVTEVMIPIEDYAQAGLKHGQAGIAPIKTASENFISSGLIMQSGHRAVLVFEGRSWPAC